MKAEELSLMSFVIHMASLVACVLAMYSASVINKAIVGCRLLLQKMAPLPIMNTNPRKECKSFILETTFKQARNETFKVHEMEQSY
jgi:hypothetical protein